MEQLSTTRNSESSRQPSVPEENHSLTLPAFGSEVTLSLNMKPTSDLVIEKVDIRKPWIRKEATVQVNERSIEQIISDQKKIDPTYAIVGVNQDALGRIPDARMTSELPPLHNAQIEISLPVGKLVLTWTTDGLDIDVNDLAGGHVYEHHVTIMDFLFR